MAALLCAAGAWCAPAHAASRTPGGHAVGADAVSCPTELGGAPLSTEEPFAGSTRPLADDQGTLVRFTLLCPYRRPGGASIAELTLTWSRYPADDLSCRETELTSEPTGDGRVQGARDHRTSSARVTYGAVPEISLTTIDAAATELLAEVPGDAHRCAEEGDAGIGDGLALPSGAASSSSSRPVTWAVAAAAIVATLLLVAVVVLRRRSPRRRALPAPAATPAAPTVSQPGSDDLATLVIERERSAGAMRSASAQAQAIEAVLVGARSDLAMDRAHVQAVRRLAASFLDASNTGYVASYSGVMTMAAAATNLVSTGARRAGRLFAPPVPAVAEAEARLDEVHGEVMVAAESALDDTRYWLWQDRRLAVVDGLAMLERLAPRQVALQQRMAVHVTGLAARLGDARAECARARSAIDDLDRRILAAEGRRAGEERHAGKTEKPLGRSGA